MTNQIELDEKYFVQSHKGLEIKGIKGKKRGTPASKRGLSNEQVCILCGVERLGPCFSRAYNMAKPSSEDVDHLGDHIAENSFVWIDGLRSYHHMLENKHCTWKELVDYKKYDKVNHLNNVNSFHEKMEDQYKKYRGVASKYINRYCALFDLQREFAEMDRQEFLTILLSRLRKISDYFLVREITNCDLFNPFANSANSQ